jgi:hypothetical protein
MTVYRVSTRPTASCLLRPMAVALWPKTRDGKRRKINTGSKRERFISNAAVNQMVLPFDTEDDSPPPQGQATEKIEYTRRKYTKALWGRTKLPDHLPVKEIEIQPEEDTQGMKCIGKEVTAPIYIIAIICCFDIYNSIKLIF